MSVTLYINGTQRKSTPQDHWIVAVADKKDNLQRETALVVPAPTMLYLISQQPKKGFANEEELMKWTEDAVKGVSSGTGH